MQMSSHQSCLPINEMIFECTVHVSMCECDCVCECACAWVGIWNWLPAVTRPTQQPMFILIRYAKDRRKKRVSVKAARVGTRRAIDRWGNAGVFDRLKSESHRWSKMSAEDEKTEERQSMAVCLEWEDEEQRRSGMTLCVTLALMFGVKPLKLLSRSIKLTLCLKRAHRIWL